MITGPQWTSITWSPSNFQILDTIVHLDINSQNSNISLKTTETIHEVMTAFTVWDGVSTT